MPPARRVCRASYGARAAFALLAILQAACTMIGPSVPVFPGPGKSAETFARDRTACMAETDARVQPMANGLNLVPRGTDGIAADNQAIQRAYDDGYGRCMAAMGNVAPRVAVLAATAAPAASPSSRKPDGGADTLPGGWRLMEMSYHGVGKPKDANDVLWGREIANSPAGNGVAPIYSISFRDGDRTVLLSIAGQAAPACDDGPNGFNATRDYAVCPGKVALVEGGRVVAVHATGSICAEAVNAGVTPGAPDWKDPARWGTRGRYDAASGTVELMTMQNGRPEPSCGKRLHAR